MSEAMKLIVNSYVKLGSIEALEDMLDHRRRIARQLQFRSISGYDLSILTTVVDKEIALIEEGIQRMKDPSTPLVAERKAEQQEETRIAETSVTSVKPQEPASRLIDSVVELLKKSPAPPSSNLAQVEGVTIVTENAPVQEDASTQTPIFDEYTLGGKISKTGFGWP
jgi:hypothetical protein